VRRGGDGGDLRSGGGLPDPSGGGWRLGEAVDACGGRAGAGRVAA
jgi:hypothetical protein